MSINTLAQHVIYLTDFHSSHSIQSVLDCITMCIP